MLILMSTTTETERNIVLRENYASESAITNEVGCKL